MSRLSVVLGEAKSKAAKVLDEVGIACEANTGTVYFWVAGEKKSEKVEAATRGEAMSKIKAKYPAAINISCPMNDFENTEKAKAWGGKNSTSEDTDKPNYRLSRLQADLRGWQSKLSGTTDLKGKANIEAKIAQCKQWIADAEKEAANKNSTSEDVDVQLPDDQDPEVEAKIRALQAKGYSRLEAEHLVGKKAESTSKIAKTLAKLPESKSVPGADPLENKSAVDELQFLYGQLRKVKKDSSEAKHIQDRIDYLKQFKNGSGSGKMQPEDEESNFDKLKNTIKRKEGYSDKGAAGAAYVAGVKKYGKAGMAKKAAAGKAHEADLSSIKPGMYVRFNHKCKNAALQGKTGTVERIMVSQPDATKVAVRLPDKSGVFTSAESLDLETDMGNNYSSGKAHEDTMGGGKSGVYPDGDQYRWSYRGMSGGPYPDRESAEKALQDMKDKNNPDHKSYQAKPGEDPKGTSLMHKVLGIKHEAVFLGKDQNGVIWEYDPDMEIIQTSFKGKHARTFELDGSDRSGQVPQWVKDKLKNKGIHCESAANENWDQWNKDHSKGGKEYDSDREKVSQIKAKNPNSVVHNIGDRVHHKDVSKVNTGVYGLPSTPLKDRPVGTVTDIQDHGAGMIAHYVLWPKKRKPTLHWGSWLHNDNKTED